jgi:hypothetical protein
MNQGSIKAFILLDVLFGLNLLLALVLLCGYFTQMVYGFSSKGAACRRLIVQYYCDQVPDDSDVLTRDVTLYFEQKTALDRDRLMLKKSGVFLVLQDPHVAESNLYVRFDENAA